MSEDPIITESELKLGRIHAIDVIRGLAIIFMLWAHFMIFFSAHVRLETPIDYFIHGAISLAGPFSAPFFFIMSGMSLAIATKKRRRKKIPESKIRNHVLKRGIVLIALGYCVNFLRIFWSVSLIGLFDQLFFWELLQALGFLMILSYFCLRLSNRSRLILLFVVSGIIVSVSYFPMLLGQSSFNTLYTLWYGTTDYYKSFSGWQYFINGFSVLAIFDLIKQVFWAGFFPVIPWIFFNLFGTLISSFLIEFIEKNEYQKFMRYFLTIGLSMLFIGFLIFILTNIPLSNILNIDVNFYCITLSGSTLLIFIAFYSLLDYKKNRSSLVKTIENAGNLPLTLYVLHAIILVIFLEGFSVYIYRIFQVFYFPFVLIPVGIFILIFLVISHVWRKKNFKYSLDWVFAKFV